MEQVLALLDASVAVAAEDEPVAVAGVWEGAGDIAVRKWSDCCLLEDEEKKI